MTALPFFASFITALTMLAGAWLGGVWTFLTPIVVFGAVPVLDAVLGHNEAETMPEGAKSPLLDSVVRLWAPVMIVVLAVSLSLVAWGGLTTVELAGLLVSTSLVTVGGAINAAHELMHRKSKLDRALAEFLMTCACYTHFCIEHVHGHHKNVSTPLDPASATAGSSVYAFVPKSLVGGLRSAIGIEMARNAKRGVPWLSWKNRLTRYAIDVVVALALVLAVFGPTALVFFVAQAAIASSLLEVINYVEHYGLQRAEVRPGVYERVRPWHSWNTNHRLSNWWLFNLQRHADHHANVARPYYNLRAFDDGPQLPFGYPTAILVALVPPVWWAVMDPRVARAAEPVAAK